ncbi:N-methylhydantoinase B/acetone carboxylase, alpha subunit [Phenylobacterium zucineum HLK1]|uniref:N-methylhydantoinase B/acetone carboxylase, alpha subunit n=1 Tax=Phenylobacterium zucineum (strain HLK1) TaxID=450851 RepID=B4RFW6_PHEZH|nr:hydantoinase B/oxoprolinase family protein [Phenylobacterium zucineum]ACG78779.1 N-methylhydantoinase B/acetone carboxylase, alpha subunit [Phenylobacterium zucineum HLK1]
MAERTQTQDAAPQRQFDAIAMEVFSNRMLSITENMAIHMMRSSYSAQIKERRDFSVGIFDAQGRLIAQGTHIPIHLGSLLGSVEALLARYRITDMVEGDAFICNDPYLAGGTHMPDVSIVTPVFIDGQVAAFAANIGHHSDLGGAVPGSISPDARSIFEEGLRLPIIRIARGGEIDEDLLNLIAANSRMPEERRLDLRVQVAVNVRGGDETRALFKRMGLANAQAAVEDVFAYTAERLRRRISALPAGEHTFRTWLDDDGAGSGPVPIVVTAKTGGNALHLDLEGTGPQAGGAFNVPASALRATVYYCVKALLDPELMPNSGMFEAVTISAPKGSIANPNYPAATGVRSNTCQKIAGAVFGAFRGLVPTDRQIASSHDLLPSFFFSGVNPETGRFYVCAETVGGGSGARENDDGADAIHVHITNSLNLPTEAMENEYPLLCEGYSLAVDSGGAGRQRGGLGIVRHVRALQDNTVFSARSDAYIHGAEGIYGGRTGGLSSVIRNAGRADEQVLPTKVPNLVLAAGESIRVQTPGGGGFGPCDERPLGEIARDLRDGIITQSAAERDYGAARVREALNLL